MPGFLDIMDAFNWLDRLEGVFSSFVHADWKGASQRDGAAGVAAEALVTLVGGNVWHFKIPRDSNWTGQDLEKFLSHYGIAIWGRRITSKHVHFSVKERQANWAEYLLLRRGIPISGPLFNPQNAVYGQQHAPGDAPPAWADRKRPQRNWADRFLDFFG